MFCERGGWGGGGEREVGNFGRARNFFTWFFFIYFSLARIYFLYFAPPPPPPPITWLFSSDLSLRYTELWQKRPNNQNILYCVLEPKVFNKTTQFKSSAIRTVNNFALLFLTVRSKQSRIRGALRSKIYFCRFVFSQAIFGLFFVFFFFFTDLTGGTDVLSLALWLASLNVNDSYCWQHWSSYFWSYEQAARLREAIFKIACYSRPIWILNIIPGD